jgi:hypothetical protein
MPYKRVASFALSMSNRTNHIQHFLSINATSVKDDEEVPSCDAAFDCNIHHAFIWYVPIYVRRVHKLLLYRINNRVVCCFGYAMINCFSWCDVSIIQGRHLGVTPRSSSRHLIVRQQFVMRIARIGWSIWHAQVAPLVRTPYAFKMLVTAWYAHIVDSFLFYVEGNACMFYKIKRKLVGEQ